MSGEAEEYMQRFQYCSTQVINSVLEVVKPMPAVGCDSRFFESEAQSLLDVVQPEGVSERTVCADPTATM